MNLPSIIAALINSLVIYVTPPNIPPRMLEPVIQKQEQIITPKENTQELREQLNESSSYEVLSSWYGPGFHGRQTANGEIFDQYAMTAASPTLPFGTQLEVTYGTKSVVVTINDRGPYHGNRQLDLSMGAAQQLGIDGVAYVRVKEL